MRSRIFGPQRSEPKIPVRSARESRKACASTASAIISANDDVAHSTVVCMSCISSSCRSRFPGPVGTTIAPSLSAPHWKPEPAVHKP